MTTPREEVEFTKLGKSLIFFSSRKHSKSVETKTLKKTEEVSTPESGLDCIARGNRNTLTDGDQNLYGQVIGHQIWKVSSL